MNLNGKKSIFLCLVVSSTALVAEQVVGPIAVCYSEAMLVPPCTAAWTCCSALAGWCSRPLKQRTQLSQ